MQMRMIVNCSGYTYRSALLGVRSLLMFPCNTRWTRSVRASQSIDGSINFLRHYLRFAGRVTDLTYGVIVVTQDSAKPQYTAAAF